MKVARGGRLSPPALTHREQSTARLSQGTPYASETLGWGDLCKPLSHRAAVSVASPPWVWDQHQCMDECLYPGQPAEVACLILHHSHSQASPPHLHQDQQLLLLWGLGGGNQTCIGVRSGGFRAMRGHPPYVALSRSAARHSLSSCSRRRLMLSSAPSSSAGQMKR